MIIKSNKDEIENYIVDAANYKGFCDEVYIPENTDEVVQIISKANIAKTHVTVSGSGTGLTGGRVPEGGIVLSTERLNKIISVDKEQKIAVVQPGVILKDFQDYVESLNLFYPPDPTEKNCFIGATVATNSSGAKTFKYGATRNFVIGLKIVLPTGEFIFLNRGKEKAENKKLIFRTESGRQIELKLPNINMPNTKNAAGYFIKQDMDLIDLFIGSEGTLGVITEIKLKLLPLFNKILSSVIFFNSEEDALQFLTEARKCSYLSRSTNNTNEINARGLEFFDAFALKFLKDDYPQIPNSADAAVWLEQELDGINDPDIVDKWIKLIEDFNGNLDSSWIATDKKDIEKFKSFRHDVSLKVNEYIAEKGLMKVGTDVAVPDKNFIEFYYKCKDLAVASKIRFLIYGHFGNSHIHLNLLPENHCQYQKAKELYMKICKIAVDFGGTISAEHGIGKLKREYLLMMYGEKTIKEMAKIKKLLDPNLILGLGNIFDIKYLRDNG